MRAFDSTPVEERENWFADFPGKESGFAAFHTRGFALKGHYAGRSPECFSFVGVNLLRKYGANWQEDYRQLVHRRLRSWGLNTIANWSDDATRRLRQTPYTDSIGSGRTKPIAGSEGYWAKFPDVFDAGFQDNLRRAMESKQSESAGDPWCIGYFSDNEMSWGDDVSLAIGALQSPADQPAKQAFLEDLKAKYRDIESLNRARFMPPGMLCSKAAPRRTRPRRRRTWARSTAALLSNIFAPFVKRSKPSRRTNCFWAAALPGSTREPRQPRPNTVTL